MNQSNIIEYRNSFIQPATMSFFGVNVNPFSTPVGQKIGKFYYLPLRNPLSPLFYYYVNNQLISSFYMDNYLYININECLNTYRFFPCICIYIQHSHHES